MNNNNTITFAFNLSDLPMLAHALMISGTTAMMCGNKDAQKRSDELRDMFEEHIPEAVKIMDDEEWIEIINCLGQSSEWFVYLGGTRWGGRARYITVDIDGKTWKAKHWIDNDKKPNKQINGLIDALEEMAPLSTKMIDRPE